MYSAITIPLSFQYLKKLLGRATREGIDTIIIRAKGETLVLKTKTGRGMQTTILTNPSPSQVLELLGNNGDNKVLLYRYTGYLERKKTVQASQLRAALQITESLETALDLLLEEP